MKPQTFAASPDLRRTLREEFGFRRLRHGQEQVIRSVLAGRDTLAVMPTGAGKSLCYQLPGLELVGTTVIVSPLISLMKDQVDKLAALGRTARRLDSTVGAAAERETLAELAAGRVEFLFVTPERLAKGEFLDRLDGVTIDFVVVDEAHCVSRWGHDFRPDYLEIGAALDRLGRPPFLALTATAGPEVVADVREHLHAPDLEVVETGLYRPNLHLESELVDGDEAKRPRVVAALEETGGPAIVYVATVRHAEELAEHLRSAGLDAGAYHGRLPRARRTEVQDRFMAGELPAVVATNAFGMGIDKPDIRLVLHYDLPASPDAYYQEAGRAGRDGEPARCLLTYDPADAGVQKALLASGLPRPEDVPRLWQALAAGGEQEEAALADAAGLSNGRARTALQALLRLQLAERANGAVRTARRDLPNGLVAHIAGEYQERAEHERERLARIERYAQTALCRWANLVAYFETGDDSPRAWWCGHCDNCARRDEGNGLGARRLPAVPEVEPVHAELLPSAEAGGGGALEVGAAVRVPLYGEGRIAELHRGSVTVELPDGNRRRVLPPRGTENGGAAGEPPDDPALRSLLVGGLRQALDFEHRMAVALPAMAEAARDAELRKGLRQHLGATEGQVEGLEEVFSRLGEEPVREASRGMRAMLREARRTAAARGDRTALDAALIGAAQRAAHYEIAAYRSLATLARTLGEPRAAAVLEQLLDQETAHDRRLSKLAESRVHPRAAEGAGASLDAMTRDELYREARRLDLPGRSRMNKADLRRAVESAGASAAAG
jgi:ATP-dependent DNA helicase RecQ